MYLFYLKNILKEIGLEGSYTPGSFSTYPEQLALGQAEAEDRELYVGLPHG